MKNVTFEDLPSGNVRLRWPGASVRKLPQERPGTVEVNKFDPHRIKAHKSLPYIRYYVEDMATKERLWVSKWFSMNQVNQIENRKKVVYPSARWLDEHFPKHRDVLAYW